MFYDQVAKIEMLDQY